MRLPLLGVLPFGRRMKPSTTSGAYEPVPPPLTVVLTEVGVLKQVGTATAVYFEFFPPGAVVVMRSRSVAATPFCKTGAAVTLPAPSTHARAAVVPEPAPFTRTLGMSDASAAPVPDALVIQTSNF